jgi:hypothetical protein
MTFRAAERLSPGRPQVPAGNRFYACVRARARAVRTLAVTGYLAHSSPQPFGTL